MIDRGSALIRKNAPPNARYSGMRLNPDDTLSLSPSDLSNHLACPHLTTLSVAATRGEIVQAAARVAARRPHPPQGERARGRVPGAARGRGALDRPDPHLRRRGVRRRRGAAADRGGDPRRRRQTSSTSRTSPTAPGAASRDFLELQPDGSYEPVDTKLARTRQAGARAPALLLRRAGRRGSPAGAVERVHVENGLGERETFRAAEFEAYYRRVRERFLAAIADEPRRRTAGRSTTAGSATSGTVLAAARRRRPPRPRRGAAARARRDADRARASRRSSALGDLHRGLDRQAAAGRQRRVLREAPPPGRAAAARAATRRPHLCRAPPRRGGARLPAAARARRGRRLARHGGPPVLRACARARVPVRLAASATTTARSCYDAVWGSDRDDERDRVRAVRRLDRRAPRPLPGHARLPLRRVRALGADAA